MTSASVKITEEKDVTAAQRRRNRAAWKSRRCRGSNSRRPPDRALFQEQAGQDDHGHRHLDIVAGGAVGDDRIPDDADDEPERAGDLEGGHRPAALLIENAEQEPEKIKEEEKRKQPVRPVEGERRLEQPALDEVDGSPGEHGGGVDPSEIAQEVPGRQVDEDQPGQENGQGSRAETGQPLGVQRQRSGFFPEDERSRRRPGA